MKYGNENIPVWAQFPSSKAREAGEVSAMPRVSLPPREAMPVQQGGLEPAKRTSKKLSGTTAFQFSPSPSLARAVKIQPVLSARSLVPEELSRVAEREAILLLKLGINP